MQDSQPWTLDRQTMVGMYGQLAGQGLSWGKQLASGNPVGQVLNLETLFWAGFNIASETLSRTATTAAGTSVAGLVAPAAVQVAALNMYNAPARRILQSGNPMQILDSPFLSGTLASVIAKSYF